MEHKQLNRLVAGFVFLVSLIVYIKTLSDTVVFWDVGEFIAATYLMQVPHPPGSPLFLIIAKVFAMLPTAHDPAVRVHLVSPFASALTAAFLYLSIVKLILLWREKPSTVVDKIGIYGGAAVGALSLTFSPTFWFNAEEAEVYGMSMLFVGMITYLALRWNERADEKGNEKYILLISYLIGLSTGVHLLSLLVIFPFMMIFYFRKYEFSLNSFVKFSAAAVIIFGIVYPGIIKWLPGLLDGSVEINGQDYSNFLIGILPYAIIGGALYGVYYSHVNKRKVLNLALMSGLLIVMGYSTYALVIIRANEHPPMNENDPSTLTRLESYLNRDQYGDAPLLKRRYSTEPQHQGIYTNYSSDTDFLLRYQIDHMFLRYFLWQYCGIQGDWQDAGVNWNQLYGIPLFFGLFGCFYHFKKDKKMWFVFLTFFMIMGLVLAFYFNMQEPQPRERDYFYVGSFFVFSVWIGMGVLGLIDMLREWLKNQRAQVYAAGGALLFSAAFIPGNMLRTNYKDADRTGDYVAWDYSYNLLQSCEPDAILFTNGDNDTFPLWYLQDVEGVRRDIRIVNLSLANTPWYILQLKNETPFGAQKVPISISDEQIENLQPIRWEPRRMALPVPKNVLNQYTYLTDEAKKMSIEDTSLTNSGVIRFTFPNTMTFGSVKAIRVQDIITWDIISTNKWQRPIYVAVTSTPDSKIGLDRYFRMDGLALKLIPVEGPSDEGMIVDTILAANLYDSPVGFSKTFRRGYKYRGLNDSKVYFDENVTRLTMNYRNAFLRLALYYLNQARDNAKALQALDSMESKIPREVIPMDYRLMYDVANFYKYAGAKDKYLEYSGEVIEKLQDVIQKSPHQPLNQDNPYTLLFTIYESRGDYKKALDVLNTINSTYSATTPGLSQQVNARIAQVQSEIAASDTARKDTVATQISPKTK
ncbi:MAG TPA: DUF2723 domain-containing protein [Bacteroidota bacterium]|nr:DUF2723 domain-containing protein [Bacteroidota bacterium]